MILETAEIATKSAQEKADLVKESAGRMKESRYEAAIALALLARSSGYLELGCKTIEEFAAKKARLEQGDWTQMLSVGRRAVQFPEVDVAFRSGALNWSKIRALVPVIKKENVTEWIGKASKMTSNQLERAVSQVRDPSVGGPTHALILGLPTYERFSEFANGLRRESGEHKLSDQECFNRFLDELEAFRRAAHPAQVAEPTSASQPRGSDRSRHIPAGIRRQALIRARFRCESCGNRFGLDIHHVVSFCEGGTHELANLVVLCSLCHKLMHAEDRRDVPPADGSEHDPREGKPGAATVHGDDGPRTAPSRDRTRGAPPARMPSRNGDDVALPSVGGERASRWTLPRGETLGSPPRSSDGSARAPGGPDPR
jgi:5-methylcytosine-specific restriction endonuclease McrA